MQVYNVEVFDADFLCIFHDNIDASDFTYTEDYISYGKNTVTVRQDAAVQKGDYISISNEGDRYFGVVKTVEYGEAADMKISYAPFYSIFDTMVLFDTDLQGSGQPLERVIGQFITEMFVSNADTEQNIGIIGDISYTSATTQWGFNIKSDVEGMHRCICGLYSSLITRAFTKYGITIQCIPDMTARKVNLEIGTIADRIVTIETALKNIIAANIIVGQLAADINKLTVFDEANYSKSAVFYLHTDGSYDTTDANRILPVAGTMKSVNYSDESDFDTEAASAAADTFSEAKFNNNISIEILPTNTQFTPKELIFGQQVRIIHKGASYRSILSKKQVKGTITLTFGAIRFELTNLLKGGYFNGR